MGAPAVAALGPAPPCCTAPGHVPRGTQGREPCAPAGGRRAQAHLSAVVVHQEGVQRRLLLAALQRGREALVQAVGQVLKGGGVGGGVGVVAAQGWLGGCQAMPGGTRVCPRAAHPAPPLPARGTFPGWYNRLHMAEPPSPKTEPKPPTPRKHTHTLACIVHSRRPAATLRSAPPASGSAQLTRLPRLRIMPGSTASVVPAAMLARTARSTACSRGGKRQAAGRGRPKGGRWQRDSPRPATPPTGPSLRTGSHDSEALNPSKNLWTLTGPAPHPGKHAPAPRSPAGPRRARLCWRGRPSGWRPRPPRSPRCPAAQTRCTPRW